MTGLWVRRNPQMRAQLLELRIATPLFARKAGETLANFYFGRFLSVRLSSDGFLPYWIFVARRALWGWCFGSPRAPGRNGIRLAFALGILEISSAQLED